MVSTIPYKSAKTPKIQNLRGKVIALGTAFVGDVPALIGSPAPIPKRIPRLTATSKGRDDQLPSRVKKAISNGAIAVPTPSNAFRTRSAESALPPESALASVFSAGTVSPKPMPRQVVATNSVV